MLTMEKVRATWPNSPMNWIYEKILAATSGLTTPGEIPLSDEESDTYARLMDQFGTDPLTPLMSSLGELLKEPGEQDVDPMTLFVRKTKLNMVVEMGRNNSIHLTTAKS